MSTQTTLVLNTPEVFRLLRASEGSTGATQFVLACLLALEEEYNADPEAFRAKHGPMLTAGFRKYAR